MKHSAQKFAGAVVAAAVGFASFAVVSSPAAQAAAPGRIFGSVTVAGGGPAAGIYVAAMRWQADVERWVEEDSATSSADGAYNIGKLLPGTYVVRFYDARGALATEFYQEAVGPEDAMPIVITEGRERLASAELGGAAHLTGRVTGSTGAGIEGAEITAYVQQPSGWAPLQSVVSGAGGAYDLGGLRAATYTLGFHDPASQVTEFWNDQASLAAAEPINIRSIGTTDGLNAQLATPVAEQPAQPVPTVTETTTKTTTTNATTTTTTPPAPSPTTLKTIAVTRKPVIKGTAKVGARLRVTTGRTNPTAVVRKVQWMVGGKVIKKATKRRLKVTRKMRGKKVTVRMTISAPGYQTLVVKTRPTKKVKA